MPFGAAMDSSAFGAAMDSTASLSSGTRDCDRGGVSGLFPLGGADVDLEVHVPLAQHLGIGDDPAPAFKGDVVADLQDLADVVRRHVTAVLEVDAVAVAADHGRTSTLPGRILAYGRTRPERGLGSVEGGGRLVVASLAGPAFGSTRHLQRAQLTCQSGGGDGRIRDR